jgi:hypothetical protein
MEFLSILLASLFSAISPLGLIVDQRLESAFRSRVRDVETLEVRVDNTPSYQLLQGKIQRIRLASRNVTLTSNLRLKSFALETDPIAVNFTSLREGEFDSLSQVRTVLAQPFNVALKLSLSETDLNQFLSSPDVQARLEAILQRIANQLPSGGNQRYELLSAQLQFFEDNRLSLEFQVRVSRRQREDFQNFQIRLVSGIAVRQGKQVTLVEPELTIDGEPLPPQLVRAVSQRISSRFNLEALEKEKILARLLQLKIEEDEVELAAFVQIASEATPKSGRLPRNSFFSSSSLTNYLFSKQ